MDDEVQCTFCGIGVPSDEEQIHINTMHKEEDEALGEYEAPMYTAPEYKAPKYEAPDINELRKLTREVHNINGTMNDLSS